MESDRPPINSTVNKLPPPSSHYHEVIRKDVHQSVRDVIDNANETDKDKNNPDNKRSEIAKAAWEAHENALRSPINERRREWMEAAKPSPELLREFEQSREIAGAIAVVADARINKWRAQLNGVKYGGLLTEEYSFYEEAITKCEQRLAEKLANTEAEHQIWGQAIYDKICLDRYGLMFDDQMTKTIDEIIANTQIGKPTLLVGEMGIAKTNVAKFIGELSGGYELISGHADMTSDTITGKIKQTPKIVTEKTTGPSGEQTVSEKEVMAFYFEPSKIMQAMEKGNVVILDEINFIEPSVLARMQDYLLQKPGKTVKIQENGVEEILIKPGYTVIATANELDNRYENRYKLDNATRDRFEATRIGYPDVDASEKRPVEVIPTSLLRLATASSLDASGYPSKHVNLSEIEGLCRLAYLTEYLYTVPAKKSRVESNDSDEFATSNMLEEEPILSQCITSRTLGSIISKVRSGNSPATLKSEISKVIDGFTNGADRQQVKTQAKLLGIDIS